MRPATVTAVAWHALRYSEGRAVTAHALRSTSGRATLAQSARGITNERERSMKLYSTHGTGAIDRSRFDRLGENVIFEPGALAFHPERIRIGRNVYVGHYAILKGYYKNEMVI